MNISKIVFSPTGGTRQVTDLITESWGMPVNEIDLTNAETDYASLCLNEDDIAVFAVPSFGGRVPALAAQRIAQIRANQTQCVIICVYGNRAYEDTLIELSDIAQKSGFIVIAAVAAIAEHSIMHQYATGRPDAQDKQQLQSFAERILAKINSNTAQACTMQIPGKRPYKSGLPASLVPKADSKCTKCGLCAKECPAQAIHKENPQETDSHKCISCMRCVALCPQSARKVNAAKVSIVSHAIKKACSIRKENELYL